MTKICNHCKIEKELTKFYPDKQNRDGRRGICAACCIIKYKDAHKRYYENNKEKIKQRSKEYRLKNSEALKKARQEAHIKDPERRKRWYLNRVEKSKQYRKERYQRRREISLKISREYWIKNKEKIRERKKRYHEANKERLLARRRELYNEKRKNNPHYRIGHSMRQRVRDALKGKLKHKSTFALVGCDINYLKSYLEQKFLDGMTWENYGEWQIDHIKPCDSFDLTIPEEQIACFHYTNLQPLWKQDNLSKNNRIGKEFGNA